jgi:predicted Zn-dependent protease
MQIERIFGEAGSRMGSMFLRSKWLYKSLTGGESEKIAAEQQMGKHLAKAYLNQIVLDEDETAIRWVEWLGRKLESHLTADKRQFSFYIVKAREANAFALPGGYIFVTRALLDLCQFETDEVACVLGHEMGHVVRLHAINRFLTNKLVHLIARRVPVGGVVSSAIIGMVGDLVEKGYSRENEFEADAFGVRLAWASGFNPTGAVRFFGRLAEMSGDQNGVEAYFSSHPSFSDRISALDQAIEGL